MKFTPLSASEIQLFKQRMLLVGGALGIILLILVFRLWFLQIIEGGYYEEVSKGNRIRVIPQGAPRGVIYDRQGELLAYNRPSFDIDLIQEDTPDLALTLANLSRITGIPENHFRNIIREKRSPLKFKPIKLLGDVGRKTADLIDSYQEDLPGIRVAVEPKRLYPTAFLASHMVGYVGMINEDQLTALSTDRLLSARIIGQAGIERMQNFRLIGLDGGRQVEVDNVGRELRVLRKPVNPEPGMDIHLTIDLRLQRYVRSLMSGKKGVVIVANSRTGEILSMSSFPDYDPNLFIGGIRDEKWEELTQAEEKPLINKTIHGLYPPGSTFKMVLAAAALDSEAITAETKLKCPGHYRLNREIRYCWKRSGHGDLVLAEAIAQSCNVFFYQLGMMVGVDKISEYARLFGFGEPTGIEAINEKSGLIPTQAWKKRVLGEKWYLGETLPVAIGQGYISVTPIQLSSYVNTVANGGLWVRPTLIRRIASTDGRVVVDETSLPRDTRLLPIDLAHFDTIRDGMVMAVNGKGTARRARSRRFTIAGKTGTSELIGRKSRRRKDEQGELVEALLPHSLFVGYAPAEAPRVTVTVIVEHGQSGGKVAAPMGRKILEFYSREIEPLDDVPRGTPGGSGQAGRFRRNLHRAFAAVEAGP